MARKKVVALDCDSTVKFEKIGQEAQGFYLGYKTITTDVGDSKLHVFTGESGNFGIFGCYQLDTKLADVPKGHLTFVEFQGKAKLKGGKTMKNFDVDYDDEIALDVSTISSSNSSSSNNVEESSEELLADDSSEDDVDDSVIEEEEVEAQQAKTQRPLSKASTHPPAALNKQSQSNIQALLAKSKR